MAEHEVQHERERIVRMGVQEMREGYRKEKAKVTKCLFPVAGLKTRFFPVTKEIAKEMLPLVNRPIISYGVEEALASGCSDIIMITGRAKRSIEDYFVVSLIGIIGQFGRLAPHQIRMLVIRRVHHSLPQSAVE